MRNDDPDARGEARGGAAAANGAAGVVRKRRKRKTRRSWSVEEKIRIARESLASGETITAVAQRHGIPRNRLSSWRTQLRRGQLVAPSSAQAHPDGGFAAVAVEAAHSAVIEGRGVTVRLEGIADTGGIAAIAVALAGTLVMVSLGGTRIVVATRAVDFRKGHDGLAAVVHNELGLNPYSGVAYVFRAKRADRIKVLWWDGTGLVLAYKRLEQGRFAWPAVHNGVIRLTRAQFEALFEGLDWRRAWSPRVRRPRTAA